MDKITVDFSKSCGAVKPMHSVNNGPAYKFADDQRITNIDSYKAAGIPLSVHGKKGCEHHPHGLEDASPIIDFIEKWDF